MCQIGLIIYPSLPDFVVQFETFNLESELGRKTELRLFKTSGRADLLYGAECWYTTKEITAKVQLIVFAS